MPAWWRAGALSSLEAIAAGAFGTVLLVGAVASRRVFSFAVGASDFHDYCQAVQAVVVDDMEHFPAQRSRLLAELPGLFAPHVGVLHGLIHASFLSTLVLMVALFAWASALGGRRAGWFSVTWASAFGPLVMLGRTVSFYPEIVAVYAVAAASLTHALVRGERRWLLASGVAVALVPLADVRSVVLFLALLPLAVLAGFGAHVPAAGAPRRWAERLAWACLPLVFANLSWRLGPWAFPIGGASVQSVVAAYMADAGRAAGAVWPVPDGLLDTPFSWGHHAPARLLPTLQQLAEVERARPAIVERLALDSPSVGELRDILPGLVAAGAAAALALLRRPRALFALFAVSAPFALLLRAAALSLPHPRQLAQGAGFLPVVLGVGSAALLAGLGHGLRWAVVRLTRRTVPERWAGRLDAVATGLAVALVAAALAGRLPSAIGPDAVWRDMLSAESEPHASIDAAQGHAGTGPPSPCVGLLMRDLREGHSLDVPWLPPARKRPADEGRAPPAVQATIAPAESEASPSR